MTPLPFLEYGSGSEVIILLHGFPANAESWEPTAKALAAKNFRVLVPMQRGYSDEVLAKKRGAALLEQLVNDVVVLIKKSNVKKAHIVGHDWGGAIAWALASKQPGRVASLTVVSTPHPSAIAKSLTKSDQLLKSWYILFFQLPVLPERLIPKTLEAGLIKTGLNKNIAANYAAIMQGARLTGALSWYRSIPGIIKSFTFGPVAPRTLFIYGGKDAFLSAKAAELTSNWVTGEYHFSCWPKATHWIPEESPAKLARAIERFVRGADLAG